MDRKILVIIAALLLVAAAGYFALVQEQGDYTKVIVLTMHVGKEGVAPVAEEIRYGHAPATGLISGAFRGTFTDGSGHVVQEFGIHDPRVQFGDRVTGSGAEGDILSGVTVVEDDADLFLIAPYTGKEEKFALTDAATGKTLAASDLSGAIDTFRETYPDDPGAAPQQTGPAGGLTVPLMLGGIVLVVLFIAVFILMIRKK